MEKKEGRGDRSKKRIMNLNQPESQGEDMEE